jgi:hypothetical protein
MIRKSSSGSRRERRVGRVRLRASGLRDTYYGPDGVREFFRTWIGAFADWGYEADEVIDAGSSVVVQVHQVGPREGQRHQG